MIFYDTMSLSKKRNLDTTLQVYTLDQLDPTNVGVWRYKHEEVKSDRGCGANPAIYGWGKPQTD